jgi:hypothetical protein
MAGDFVIRPECAGLIRWSRRGSCGNSGCKDPECGCSICGEPIGIPEDDPRRDGHDENCPGCAICEDDIPIMLWRGQGKDTEQAQFHSKCFGKVIWIRSRAG